MTFRNKQYGLCLKQISEHYTEKCNIIFALVKSDYPLHLQSTSVFDMRCWRCINLHLQEISWYLIFKTITCLSNLLNWSFTTFHPQEHHSESDELLQNMNLSDHKSSQMQNEEIPTGKLKIWHEILNIMRNSFSLLSSHSHSFLKNLT